MEKFYSILIDLGVLGLFGLLYYILQRRRILRASSFEAKERIQEFLYNLHSFLDGKESSKSYAALDGYARELESAANESDLKILEQKIREMPGELPQDLREELKSILNIF